MIQRIKHFFKINWFQTLKVNYLALPFSQAVRLPVIVYRGFVIREFQGKIIFNVPVVFGIIGFGQPYEIFTKVRKSGEATINGTIEINGKVQFGLDTKLYVLKNAYVKFGHINSFASRTEVICFKEISFGNWVQFGTDCLIVDTNFHQIKTIAPYEILPMNQSIFINNHNYIGARTTIKGRTHTPDNCMIASNSLCTKDYRNFGEHILIGGIPAQFIKDGISRDWEAEKESLENYLTIKL